MIELNTLQLLIIMAPPLLLAITLHEVAHGWVALRCGDATAQAQGRLSLNPLRHVDPMGTVLVPALLAVFGGFISGCASPSATWRWWRWPDRAPIWSWPWAGRWWR
jgi:Zn-dependent protease